MPGSTHWWSSAPREKVWVANNFEPLVEVDTIGGTGRVLSWNLPQSSHTHVGVGSLADRYHSRPVPRFVLTGAPEKLAN